jgi:uncharacterized protein YaeQ
MSIGATVYTFTVQLADVDRGVYEDLTVRAARHSSETDTYLLTRVLAYCLEYAEGIMFTDGISATDEPAIVVRDMTGALVAWVEIGAPDAARLHTGSLQAPRVAVYTHRDPAKVAAAWAGKRIHRGDEIVLRSFDPGFIDAAARVLERRTTLTLSVTENRIYLDINGTMLETDLHERGVD